MLFDAMVVGGGLSGLSSAVHLSSLGRRILLVERKPHCGGRTCSFLDSRTGDPVDNGQHLLMGCYHETRRYLRLIGSEHRATLQKNLHIDFLHSRRGVTSLSCPPLPAPWHLLGGLLRLRSLRFSDRVRLLRVGFDLRSLSESKKQRLAKMTVAEWMTRLGQTEETKKYLWDIIAIGTLNDDPKSVSALLFFRVLEAAFLGTPEDSCLMIPNVGLSELLVEPALTFIRKNGGKVLSDFHVKEIWAGGADKATIIGKDGRKHSARCVISAVPYHDYPGLKVHGNVLNTLQNSIGSFQSSPIITINLWLDREILKQEFVAILDSPIQWVFNRSRILGRNKELPQFLAIVISAAGRVIDMKKDELVDLALKELQRVLPETRYATIVSSLVVKEKRATFSPRPEVEQYRPSTETPVPNLFLAGDWTNTGYPATIEGAVMSGFRAAGAAQKFLDRR